MVINKVNVYLTSEEIDKRSNLYYALFEQMKPLYEAREVYMISKYVKKCMLDVQEIENEAKKRYILALKGDKSAIIRDIEEILKAVTKEDFQNEIFSEEQLFPKPGDFLSLNNINKEKKYTEDYRNFCIYLTQILQAQIEAFQYYDFPLEEIEKLIDEKACKCYKRPESFDALPIFRTKTGELPKVNTSKLDSICFPLDKVNSTLWYGFPVGEVKDLKAESDKDSRKGNQANIILLLDFEALNGVNISRELTVYDKWVWNACANLKEQGHDVLTAEQIYKAMGNTGRPNAKTKEKIMESVETISRARVTIDTTEEHELYPKYDRVKATFPLLATETCTAYARGQVVEGAIRIIESPKLFAFAENRQQVTRLPLNVLDSPISKTDDNLLLSDYLLMRISKMRNSKNITRTILLDTIYQRCCIETYKQKQRLPEKIERILNHYKELEWIKDFKLTEREIEIITF